MKYIFALLFSGSEANDKSIIQNRISILNYSRRFVVTNISSCNLSPLSPRSVPLPRSVRLSNPYIDPHVQSLFLIPLLSPMIQSLSLIPTQSLFLIPVFTVLIFSLPSLYVPV